MVDDTGTGMPAAAAGPDVGPGLLGQVRHDLDAVDAALKRLEDGTYGRCEACGQPIGEDRLEVLPAARYCSHHQGSAEGGDQATVGIGQP